MTGQHVIPGTFPIGNKQSLACGEAAHRCHAYFENTQGEQLMFVYDREANAVTPYNGDLGA